MDKSHVGMSLCFFCLKAKEIVLDRRLRDSLPREAVYDHEPCRECKKWMRQGVIFISVRSGEPVSENPYRTGKWVVIKDEAVRRFITPDTLLEDILQRRFAFVDDDAWDKLGITEATAQTT